MESEFENGKLKKFYSIWFLKFLVIVEYCDVNKEKRWFVFLDGYGRLSDFF